MNFDQLVARVTKGGIEYTIVRPGISLCLWYAEPAETLAPTIANILEEYIRFVPPQSLQTYYAQSGTWKRLNSRILNSTLEKLRFVSPGENAEFHFGQEPVRNVGKFGAHFEGTPLDDEILVHEDNPLYLEFPEDVLEWTNIERFYEFVHKVASMRQFDSGYCGYAFKHLFMSHLAESFEAISHMAMRYIGFDISSDVARFSARGRVCNVSWLSLFGQQIVEALGGADLVRQALPSSMNITEVGSGLLVRAAEKPIVGDVNRGAKDVAPLRRLAKLTKHLRVQEENLGPDDPTFAERWLSRFDME